MKANIILSMLAKMILITHCLVIYSFADDPSNIKITNVRGKRFTVSWITQNKETGIIRYGKEENNDHNWKSAYDNRGETIRDDIHYITLDHLEENTEYFFDIVSGNTTDDNMGKHYSQKTGRILDYNTGSCQAAGKVFIDRNQKLPAFDSIVYVTIRHENNVSATESCLMTQSDSGYWQIELKNATTVDYANSYSFTCGESTILVQAQSGNNGFSQIVTTAVDFTTKSIPTLVLENDPMKNIIFVLQFLSGMHENFALDYDEIDTNGDGIVNFRDMFGILDEVSN